MKTQVNGVPVTIIKQTAIEVDLARPEEELTDREKELNDVERDIVSEFGDDWRVTVDILQGKKLEMVLLKFGSRMKKVSLIQIPSFPNLQYRLKIGSQQG